MAYTQASPKASAKAISVGRSQALPARAILPQHLARPSCVTRVAAVEVSTQQKEVSTQLIQVDALSAEYNRVMKDAMGWEHRIFEYSYDRGLYYHELLPNLVCGSQPRHTGDIEELKQDLGVTHIVSLQQDRDLQHWKVNGHDIRRRCESLGIEHIRCPVRDFDQYELRKGLPNAVRHLHGALSSGGRVYVHCTAGLGRAPGVIIAYLYWFSELDLHTAYNKLTSIRPCGPKKEAIRGATFDLLSGRPMDAFDHQHKDAYTQLSPAERRTLQARVLHM